MRLVFTGGFLASILSVVCANRRQYWEPVCGRFCMEGGDAKQGDMSGCEFKMKGYLDEFPPNQANVRLIGEPAPLGIFPWAVGIRFSDGKLCGGTLMSRRTVLTSAYCFAESNTDIAWARSQAQVYVGFGTKLPKSSMTHDDLGDDIYHGKGIYGIKNIFIHKKYDHSKGLHDLAILEIDGSVFYDGSIHENFEGEYGTNKGKNGFSYSRPACLSTNKYYKNYVLESLEADSNIDRTCYSVGYGEDINGQTGTLNYMNDTEILKRTTCYNMLNSYKNQKDTGRLNVAMKQSQGKKVHNSYMCTISNAVYEQNDEENGKKSGGAIACDGDTGSSVQCMSFKNDNKVRTDSMVVNGVLSWSKQDCAEENVPTINTRISGSQNWILETFRNNKLGKKPQFVDSPYSRRDNN